MTEYRAPALSRGLRIIELLSQSGAPMTMRDIVAALNLTFNHLYRIIQCLEEEGYLWCDEQDYYHLTEKIMFSGQSDSLLHLAQSDLCQTLMKTFTWKTNQPCHLAAVIEGQVRVIAHQHPEFAPSISAREGSLLNTVKSSSALLLLALSNDQESWKLIRNYTLDTTLRVVMVERLSEIKAKGYAEIPHDRIVGLISVSWPVIGRDGYAQAAITCPYFDRVPGDYEKMMQDLAELAGKLNHLLVGKKS